MSDVKQLGWCHRGTAPGKFERCVGAECMAWRWRKVPNPDWKPEQQMAMYPLRNPYAVEPLFVYSTTDGHCGLAGQP